MKRLNDKEENDNDYYNRRKKSDFGSQQIVRIICALAYFGTLFWIPLVLWPREQMARRISNQGLWSFISVLILIILYHIMEFVYKIIAHTPISFISNPLSLMNKMLLIFSIIYLVIKNWENAMALIKGNKVKGILFFDEYPLIKYHQK